MAKKKAVIIKCCLCGNSMADIESHNPDPLGVLETDRCCNSCNTEQVMPARSKGIEQVVQHLKTRGRPPLESTEIDEKEDAQTLLSLINEHFPTTRIEGFSRHLGHKPITIRRWLHGERKIPHYAFLVFKYIAFLNEKQIRIRDGIPLANSTMNPNPDWGLK